MIVSKVIYRRTCEWWKCW